MEIIELQSDIDMQGQNTAIYRDFWAEKKLFSSPLIISPFPRTEGPSLVCLIKNNRNKAQHLPEWQAHYWLRESRCLQLWA